MLGVLPFVEDPDLSVSAARATCATLGLGVWEVKDIKDNVRK